MAAMSEKRWRSELAAADRLLADTIDYRCKRCGLVQASKPRAAWGAVYEMPEGWSLVIPFAGEPGEDEIRCKACNEDVARGFAERLDAVPLRRGAVY